uniref:Uncharacterized protein n=1 Tax=Romanomermis culicivorax TaxID=13658 RepID=A0A915JQ48_ROMCU
MIRKAFDNCHKSDYASSKELEQKNNYLDVLPFDDNRVTLQELPSCSHSTYINASYVDSFYKQRAYIVTQAVKSKATCIDFWRMVWESQSNCIVMLTKVFDFMKVMCLQYWPLTKTPFGDIVVELLETKNYANFVIRTMRIAKIYDNELTSPWRLIKQFHFTEWEANGLPYISALLDFRRRIRLHMASSEKNEVPTNNNNGSLEDGPTTTTCPIIVHCSNGGERSGAFLAIDANLELAKEENIVDVFGYGKIMINARSHLINSLDLYMFIYDVLLEAVQCNIEPFPMHELKSFSTLYLTKKSRQVMEMKHSEQYKLLCHLTPQLTIGDCAGGHRLENRGKNRDVMVVPPDYARPYLSTLHGESKDYTYINAVNVDGFTRKNEWIVTEWPKHNTVDSLWALIFDHSCHTLVNLTTAPKNKKTYPPFIHNKNRHTYGPFNVEVISYQSYPYMTSHIVKVWKKTFSLSDAQVTSKANQCDFDFKVCNVISAKMWPVHNKVPQSTSGFIDVIKMVRSWRKRAPDKPELKPTVVLSHTGVTRCGIFVAANIVIDQMDMDQECDLFHACKLIKLNRPQLIDNK